MNYQSYISKKSSALRIISSIVVFLFVIHDLSMAAPSVILNTAKPAVWSDINPSFASVDEVFKGESDRIIYLIRDAHANYSAQKNIARTLKQLDDHAGLEIIFLEGADGAVSWDEAKKISDSETRQQIAEKYLRSADFQGVEYYEMTNDKTAEIWGVENRELYHSALDAFRSVEKNQIYTAPEISRISASVEELKSVYYRPSLQRLDDFRKKWLKGSATFAEYADYLATMADRTEINPGSYPLIGNVRNLSKLEEQIDFNVLNQVFADITTESYRNELSTDDEELKALSFLSGNDVPVFGKAGNTHLIRIALQKISGDIASGSVSELINRYIEYLQLSEKFDLPELIKEENKLSAKVMERLASTAYESGILELARIADDLKQISDLKMESGEYEKFKMLTRSGLRSFIGRLNELLIESGSESRLIREWKDDLENWIETAKRFYELTYLRDDYFTRSIESKLNSGNYTRSALIAGGFHTENLKHYFRVRGYSYAVITPVIDDETNDIVYKKLLLSQEYQDGHIQVASMQKPSSFGLNYWVRSQIPEVVGRIMQEITDSAEPSALSASRLANQGRRGNYRGDTSLKKVMEDVRREYTDADDRNGTQYVSKIDWSGIDMVEDVLINPNLAFSILYAMKEILNNAIDHHVGSGPVGVDFVTHDGSELSIEISVLNQGDIAWKDLADKAILHAQLNQIHWNDNDAHDLQIGYSRPDKGYSVMDPELVEIMAKHETLRKELLFIRGLSAGKRENSIGGAGIGLHFSRKFLREDGADLDFEVIRHDGEYPEVVFHITNISPVNGSRLSVFNQLKNWIWPDQSKDKTDLRIQLNALRESAGARLTSEVTDEEYMVLKRVTPRREMLDRIVSFMNRLDIQTGDPVVFVGSHTDFSAPITFAAKGADVKVVDIEQTEVISHFEKSALKHVGAMIQQNNGQYVPIRPVAYQNRVFNPDSQKLIYFPKVLDYIPVFNNTIDPGDGRGMMRMPQYMMEKAMREIENGGYLVMSFYSFWDEILEYAEKAAQHLGIEIRPIEDLPNIDYFEGKKIIGYQILKKTGARLTETGKPSEFTLNSRLIEQFFNYGYWIEIKPTKRGSKAVIHHVENDKYRRHFYFRDRVISGGIEYLPNLKGGNYVDWIFPRMPANGMRLGRAAVEMATVMFLEKNPERGRKIEIDVTEPEVAQSFSEIASFNGSIVDRSVDGLAGFEGEVSDVSAEELRYWNELNRRNRNMAPSEYRQYVINKKMRSFDPHLNFEADGGEISPSEEGSRLAMPEGENSENLRLSLEMLTEAAEEFKLFLEEYEWPTGTAGSADTAVRQQLVHGINNFITPLTWLTELGAYEQLVIEDRINDLEIASDLALKFSDLLENDQPIISSENYRFPPTYTVSWNLVGAAIKSYQIGEINRSNSAAFISLALQLDLLRSIFEDFKDRFEGAIAESEVRKDEEKIIESDDTVKELTDTQKTLIIKTGIKDPFVFDLPFEYIQSAFHKEDKLKIDSDPDLVEMIREASSDQAIVIRGHRQLFTKDRKDKGEWMLYSMVFESVIEWIQQESGYQFNEHENYLLVESMKNAGIYPDGENPDSIMIIEWHLTAGGIQVNIADQGDVFNPAIRTAPADIFDPFFYGDPLSGGGVSEIRPYLNKAEQKKEKIGRVLTDIDGIPVGKTLALNFKDKATAARLAGEYEPVKNSELPANTVLNAELIRKFFEYGYYIEWVDAVPEEITAVIYHPETAEMPADEPNKYFRTGSSSNHYSDQVNVNGSVIFFADKKTIELDMIYPNMPRTGEKLGQAAIELVTAMYFRLYAPKKRKFLVHSTNEFMNQTLLGTSSFNAQSRQISASGEKPAFRVTGAVPQISDREFGYWNTLNERNKALNRDTYRSAVLSGELKDPLPDKNPVITPSDSAGSEEEESRGSRLADSGEAYGGIRSYSRSFEDEDVSVDGTLSSMLRRMIDERSRSGLSEPARTLYIGAGSGVGVFEIQKEFQGQLQVDPVNLRRLSLSEEDFTEIVREHGFEVEEGEVSDFLEEFNQRMLLNDINLGLTGVEDGSYDFIYLSKQVMRYIKNKHIVLKEIKRVLKKDGIAVVSEAHDSQHTFFVTESTTGTTYDFFDFINRIVELEGLQKLPIQYDPIWTSKSHGFLIKNLRPEESFPDLKFKEPAKTVKGYRVPDGYAVHYLWDTGSRLSDDISLEKIIQNTWSRVEGFEARGDLSSAMMLLVELREKLLPEEEKFEQDIQTIQDNLRIMRKVLNVYQTPADYAEILNYAVAINAIEEYKIIDQAEDGELAVYLAEIKDTDGSAYYALTSSEINEDGEYRFAFSALLDGLEFPKRAVYPHTRTYIKGKGYYEKTLILALTSGILESVESNDSISKSAENAYERMMKRSQSDKYYPLLVEKKQGHYEVSLKPGYSAGARLSVNYQPYQELFDRAIIRGSSKIADVSIPSDETLMQFRIKGLQSDDESIREFALKEVLTIDLQLGWYAHISLPGMFTLLNADERPSHSILSVNHNECISCAVRAAKDNKLWIGQAHILPDDDTAFSSYVQYWKILQYLLENGFEKESLKLVFSANHLFDIDHGFPPEKTINELKAIAVEDAGLEADNIVLRGREFGVLGDVWVDSKKVLTRHRDSGLSIWYEDFESVGARLASGSGETEESVNEWQARLKFYKGRLYEGLYEAFSDATSGGIGMYVNSAGDMHTALHTTNVDTLILTDQIGLNLTPGDISLGTQQSLLRDYSQRPALSEFTVSETERNGLSLRDHLELSLQILGVKPDAIQTLSRIGESNFYKFSFDWRHPDDSQSRLRTVYIAASQPLESLTYTDFPQELTDVIAVNNGLDVFIEKAPYFYMELTRDSTRKYWEKGVGDSRGEKEIFASNRLKSDLLKVGGLIFSDKEEYGIYDSIFPTSGEVLVSETVDFEIIDAPESVNNLNASYEVTEDNGNWGNGRIQILRRIQGSPVSPINGQSDSASRLSHDIRPEESGVALPGYIRHDESIRSVINPEGKPMKVVYGGSGADITHFLKTFDADKGVFVSFFYNLTGNDLRDVVTMAGFGMDKLKDSAGRNLEEYLKHKQINGYANRHHVNEPYRIKQVLAYELLASGATDIEVVEDEIPTLRFKWAYQAGETPRTREIQFIEADITQPLKYPEVLHSVIQSGFDGFYLRAGMEIPSRYGQSNYPFIEYLYNHINQSGVFVTDDTGIIFNDTGGYALRGTAEYFYDVFPVPIDDFEYIQIPNLISIAESILGMTPVAQASPADFYGWFMRIRRIKSSPEERQKFTAGNIPVKGARLSLAPQSPVLNAGLMQQFFDYGYWIEFESGDKGHTDAYIRHIEGKVEDPDFRDGNRQPYLRQGHTFGEIEFIESAYSDSGEPGVELDNIYPRMPQNGLKLGQAAIEAAIALYLDRTDLPDRRIHVPLTEARMVNTLLEIKSLRAEKHEYFRSGEYGIKGEMLPVSQEELNRWSRLNDRNRNMTIAEFRQSSSAGEMKRFSGSRLSRHDQLASNLAQTINQLKVQPLNYSVSVPGLSDGHVGVKFELDPEFLPTSSGSWIRLIAKPSSEWAALDNRLDRLIPVNALELYRDSDEFKPPAGSFGQMLMKMTDLDGKPAVEIFEVQYRYGLSGLPTHMRKNIKKWRALAVNALTDWAASRGVVIYANPNNIRPGESELEDMIYRQFTQLFEDELNWSLHPIKNDEVMYINQKNIDRIQLSLLDGERLDTEEVLANIYQSFDVPTPVTWTYDLRSPQGTIIETVQVEAVIYYDRIFEQLILEPAGEFRDKYKDDLEILNMHASQVDIGPRGSILQFDLDVQYIDGDLTLVFDESQPSRGYKHINAKDITGSLPPNQLRRMLALGLENAVLKVIDVGRSYGVTRVLASSKELINSRYQAKRDPGNVEKHMGNFWEMYEFPYKNKGWRLKKIDRYFGFQGEPIFWEWDGTNNDGARLSNEMWGDQFSTEEWVDNVKKTLAERSEEAETSESEFLEDLEWIDFITRSKISVLIEGGELSDALLLLKTLQSVYEQNPTSAIADPEYTNSRILAVEGLMKKVDVVDDLTFVANFILKEDVESYEVLKHIKKDGFDVYFAKVKRKDQNEYTHVAVTYEKQSDGYQLAFVSRIDGYGIKTEYSEENDLFQPHTTAFIKGKKYYEATITALLQSEVATGLISNVDTNLSDSAKYSYELMQRKSTSAEYPLDVQFNQESKRYYIKLKTTSASAEAAKLTGARLSDAQIQKALQGVAKRYSDRDWHIIPVSEKSYSVRNAGRGSSEIRLDGIVQIIREDRSPQKPEKQSSQKWLQQRQISDLRSAASLNANNALNPVVLVLDTSPISGLQSNDARIDLYYESFIRFAFIKGINIRFTGLGDDAAVRYQKIAESVASRVRLELVSDGLAVRSRVLNENEPNPKGAVEAIVRTSDNVSAKKANAVHLSLAKLSGEQPNQVVDFLSGVVLLIASAEHARFEENKSGETQIQRESIPSEIISALAGSLGLKGADREEKAFWMLEADTRAEKIFFGAFLVDQLITSYKFIIRQIAVMA